MRFRRRGGQPSLAELLGWHVFQVAIGTDPLPREDDTFDRVTMMDVGYHITDHAIWSAAVRDIAWVLKPTER